MFDEFSVFSMKIHSLVFKYRNIVISSFHWKRHWSRILNIIFYRQYNLALQNNEWNQCLFSCKRPTSLASFHAWTCVHYNIRTAAATYDNSFNDFESHRCIVAAHNNVNADQRLEDIVSLRILQYLRTNCLSSPARFSYSLLMRLKILELLCICYNSMEKDDDLPRSKVLVITSSCVKVWKKRRNLGTKQRRLSSIVMECHIILEININIQLIYIYKNYM